MKTPGSCSNIFRDARRAPCAALAMPPMDGAVELLRHQKDKKAQHEAKIRELTAERDAQRAAVRAADESVVSDTIRDLTRDKMDLEARLEEARSARAALQARLEAEEESAPGEGAAGARADAEGTRGGRAGRVARDIGAAGAGGREEALAARVDVRRLEEELARVPSMGTKEGAAAARAALLEGVNALLEAAVGELRAREVGRRH